MSKVIRFCSFSKDFCFLSKYLSKIPLSEVLHLGCNTMTLCASVYGAKDLFSYLYLHLDRKPQVGVAYSGRFLSFFIFF